MAADIAQRVQLPVDMRQHDPLALDRDKRHRAGSDLRHLGDRDKAFFHKLIRHCERSEAIPIRIGPRSLRRSTPRNDDSYAASSKPNIFAALDDVIFCRSASGTPLNMRWMNCCERGKVASACG